MIWPPPQLSVTVGVIIFTTAVDIPGSGLCVIFVTVLNTGGVISSVHVTIRETDEVFPHASEAVHLRVCERLHPFEITVSSD